MKKKLTYIIFLTRYRFFEVLRERRLIQGEFWWQSTSLPHSRDELKFRADLFSGRKCCFIGEFVNAIEREIALKLLRVNSPYKCFFQVNWQDEVATGVTHLQVVLSLALRRPYPLVKFIKPLKLLRFPISFQV